MNRSMIAGLALVCGIGMAAAAGAADDKPASRASAEIGAGMDGGMGEHGGTMGGHHARHMMHRMMQMSPQQRCEEHLARRAAGMAYTVTKLKLTAEQRPLWDSVNTILQGSRERGMQLCATLQSGPGTALDRLNRREQFLTAHLQAVQQVKPALEQLYRSLTPEQKAVIDNSPQRG
jgi:predicted short-subunit dehydrogenase-like oxidoreductase (DUF2520 family)